MTGWIIAPFPYPEAWAASQYEVDGSPLHMLSIHLFSSQTSYWFASVTWSESVWGWGYHDFSFICDSLALSWRTTCGWTPWTGHKWTKERLAWSPFSRAWLSRCKANGWWPDRGGHDNPTYKVSSYSVKTFLPAYIQTFILSLKGRVISKSSNCS